MAKIIQKFARRTPTRKLTRTIQEDFQSLKEINDDNNLYFGSVRRGNKVVRLDFHLSSPEKMKLMGYDNQLSTPEKEIALKKITLSIDPDVVKEGRGRPKGSLSAANPSRVSVGEMKNPF